MKDSIRKYIIFIVVVILCLLHNSIYYISGMAICLITVPLLIWGIIVIRKRLDRNKNSLFNILVVSYFFVFSIENIIVYPYALNKYGVVYSSRIEGIYQGRHGKNLKTIMLDGSSESVRVWRTYDHHLCDTLLFAYPQLAFEKKWFFFSLFLRHEYENNPTKPQIDYCLNGAEYSDKIRYLKKHIGTIKKEDIYNYCSEIKKHDNRIISAVLEKRGRRYIYANPLQSEEKLWALKYHEVKNGTHVLIVYDIHNPSLFSVIDWNPSNEDYDYYNTKDGQKPTSKYLLKLEHLSKSLQAKNDEKRVND